MVNVGDNAFVVWQSPAHMFRAVKVKVLVSKWVYVDKYFKDRKCLIIAIDEHGALYANTQTYGAEFYDEDGSLIKVTSGTSICCDFYSESELKAFVKNTLRTNEEVIEAMKKEDASLNVIVKKFNLE